MNYWMTHLAWVPAHTRQDSWTPVGHHSAPAMVTLVSRDYILNGQLKYANICEYQLMCYMYTVYFLKGFLE